MRYLLLFVLFSTWHTYVKAQITCKGPLGLTVSGSDSGKPMEVNPLINDVYCKSVSEGSIELSITGGTPEYSCVWSTGATDEALVGLRPGTYTVTIVDNNDCKQAISIPIKVMDPTIDDLVLLKEDGCGACFLEDGSSSYYYHDEKYMTHLEDIPDGKDLGSVQVCTKMYDTSPDIAGKTGLKRSWDFQSDGGQSRVTLYFSDEELSDLETSVNDNHIVSNELRVKGYTGGQRTPENHEQAYEINSFSLNLFDDIDEVWSIQFNQDSLPSEIAYYVYYEKQIIGTDLDWDWYEHEDTSKILVNTELDFRNESEKSNWQDVENATYLILGNPTFDYLKLEVKDLAYEPICEIVISNSLGQAVYHKSSIYLSNQLYSFDVSQYEAGTYFLTINFSQSRLAKTFKFIKVN